MSPRVPAIETEVLKSLKNSYDAIRPGVADVLGEIGGDTSLAAFREIKGRSRDSVEAATRAVERITWRRPL